MRFFYIPSPQPGRAIELFQAACAVRGIEYVEVTRSSIGQVLRSPPGPGDLLFSAVGTRADRQVEALLVTEGVATFYRDHDAAFNTLVGSKGMSTLLFEQVGISVPRTVYFIDADRRRLAQAVDELGGFPVVLKVAGGQYGLGVMKVDDMVTLQSLVDFMFWKGEVAPIMQEFVDHATILRTICIGDRVVAGRRIKVLPGDFRSHSVEAVQRNAIEAQGVTEFSPAIVEMTVSATRAIGYEFAGLDIIEAKDGRVLLAEVNSPCIYVTTEETSGVPVSQLMIDYLAEKSRRLGAVAAVAT